MRVNYESVCGVPWEDLLLLEGPLCSPWGLLSIPHHGQRLSQNQAAKVCFPSTSQGSRVWGKGNGFKDSGSVLASLPACLQASPVRLGSTQAFPSSVSARPQVEWKI